MFDCKICNKNFEKLRNLSIHLFSHKIKLIEYYVEYEKFQIPKCEICQKNSVPIKGLIFRRTCCDERCIKENQKRRRHSSETKKIISKKRKSFLSSNPDKHPWKRKNKNISEPCEVFKTKLKNNNITFLEEFSPLKDRYYSIDICFPNIKIGIEINGNQHYNSDKSLKKYYQDRKNNIESEGWKIYDIYYTKVYDENFCESFINELKNNQNLDNLDFDFNINQEECKYCSCGKKILKTSTKCSKCFSFERRKVNRPNHIQLENEIKKNGYRKTGKKYGVSDTAIRKWLHSSVDRATASKKGAY